ncbi:acyltransferase family protein [Siphonobacter curvatus]|uniref:Acyltransferase 3 domain-containing protein n=1 Tax=Siphonobacter curvatus TaxID=2094562 RepID=A0A2S7IFX0_9BACT|nr:acyltransferase [Siphonobacter curvatus]PQA53791.1 hypothetical protein C5O19_24275 [Siphonobacter curvatus]
MPSDSTSLSVGKIPSKIYYLDYDKILLTALVILHHIAITYGAPGGWYYQQPTTQVWAKVGLALFVATNQSFFMGLFFLLSSYFIEPSYQRKGAQKFVLDRLKRLGIPLVFYSLLLSPVMNFLVYRYGHHQQATFLQFIAGYDNWIDPGVLWFVAALLLFNVMYVLFRLRFSLQYTRKLPSGIHILWFAVSVGLISFIVRLVFPVGWVLSPVGFQLCYFPQYVALFVVGIVAQQNQWLDQLSPRTGKQFFRIALVGIVIVFPLLFVVTTKLGLSMSNFNGGFNEQSLVLCLWEQITGLSMCVALLSYSKYHWNVKSTFLNMLARSTYSTYILHPLVVIVLSLLFAEIPMEPVMKLLIVAPLAIIGSFSIGRLALKLPAAQTIL